MSEARENRLVSTYRRYLGIPDRTIDVYAGFGLFFAGLGLCLAGILTFLYSATLPDGAMSTYGVREIAAVMAAIGLPALLTSVVVLLPVDRRTIAVAGIGTFVTLVATALFVWAYPADWNVATSPDYSALGVGIYAVGFVLVVAGTGAALVAQYIERVTPVKETPDDTTEESVSDAAVQADIDQALEGTEFSVQGGRIGQERRLEFDTTVDDLETNVSSAAATTHTTDESVDETVSQLHNVKGPDNQVRSEETTDAQVDALAEVRERESTSEDDRAFVDRVRDLW